MGCCSWLRKEQHRHNRREPDLFPSNKRGLHHQDGSEGQALKGPLKRKTIVCIILSAASRMLRTGTLHIAVRAEDAAIILSRLKHHGAPLALIKVLARIRGHDLALPMSARGTLYRRLHLHPRSSSTASVHGRVAGTQEFRLKGSARPPVPS